MKRLFFSLAALVMAASAAAAAELPLVIDPAQSRVEVLVKATVDSFTANLVDYRPSVTVDPEGARIVAAAFVFRFQDVRTGKEKRDHEMHEWQQTTTYPDGRFVLTALEPGTAGNGAMAGNGHLTARGTLTFHGVTKDLAFPVAITTDKALYSIDGEATVDTRDFGLPVIRKFAVLKVDPNVKVRFHLQGSVAP